MENFNAETIEPSERKADIERVESVLRGILPKDELLRIFGKQTYLIGGSVRDAILGKSLYNSDFDLMTRLPIDDILENLQRAGFIETKDEKFSEGKFSIKDGVGVINILINGREIQVGLIGEKSIEDLISTGDINLNCCVFDLDQEKIVNIDKFDEILGKNLSFCNIELAKSDPMKIVSALKQISRIPDLKISDETLEVIKNSIPKVIEFFISNPHRRHKLKSILGNINSDTVMKFFEGYNTHGIFDGIEFRRSVMNVSEPYLSSTVDSLSPEVREGISSLIVSQFGKRLNSSKIFDKKVNSVVYELDDNKKVISCALMDRERMYAVASVSPENMISMVSNMIKNNYNVWTTISSARKYLIEMSKTAGLKLVDDPLIVEKILLNNYPNYSGRIITERKGDLTVFYKKDSDDSPQVLLVS